MNLIFEQLNPGACRSYLLGVEGQEEVTIIDPVLSHVERYCSLLRERGLRLSLVVDTHAHADHISAAAALKKTTGCRYAMLAGSPVGCAEVPLSDGMQWSLPGGIPVRVLHTPGHTKDSICLLVEDKLFTGDALLLDDGGAGRDDLPGGDPGAHWESLKRLGELPEGLIVYPAHDYRGRTPSSLGQQKRTNPHLRPRTRAQFANFITDLKLGPADWMKDVLRANYACATEQGNVRIPSDPSACEVMGTLPTEEGRAQIGSIEPSELKALIDAGTPPVLLDVREARELVERLGHLEGIIHIPVGALEKRIGDLRAHENDQIAVICRSGGRPRTAAQILAANGFRRARVLSGGMMAWRNQGY